MTTTTATTATQVHADALAAAREYLANLSPQAVAQLADCGAPADGTTGADALDSARSIAAEAISEHMPSDPREAAEWLAEHDDGAVCSEIDDSVHENVDSLGVLIYTARCREAFHQLNGWEEDVEELGPIESLDQAATVAVYLLLRRVAFSCVEAFAGEYVRALDEAGGMPDEDDDEN